jgi:hypothetical protein
MLEKVLLAIEELDDAIDFLSVGVAIRVRAAQLPELPLVVIRHGMGYRSRGNGDLNRAFGFGVVIGQGRCRGRAWFLGSTVGRGGVRCVLHVLGVCSWMVNVGSTLDVR